MARAQNPKFNHGTRDEREAAAHEEPPYRDRSVAIALHEANSWREVSSPAILHPPFLRSCARAVWQVSSWCGRRERHAGADSTVKMTTHEAALLGPQKDTTTLWAAATFMFLEMPLNATAAHILVAAAAFGGPHAKGWPALHLR